MAGYTKLFASILDSTVWALSKEARILWITLLVKKNREQMIASSIPGLAHAARLTIPETEKALKELEAPDKYSQTKDHDGRRVIRQEGGWFVTSGAKYRDMLSLEERREYQRQKQAEYRKRRKTLKHSAGCEGAREAIQHGFNEQALSKNGDDGLAGQDA